MGAVANAFATAFRDFVTDGIPASGANESVKAQIRAIGPILENALANAGLGALVGVVKATKSNLDADLAHAANTVALVYGDSTDANNDLYTKSGSSGSGSWTNTGILHGIMATLGQPYVDDAEAAAVLAQAWSEGTEPGGSGTKSAREWAEGANESAGGIDLTEPSLPEQPVWTAGDSGGGDAIQFYTDRIVHRAFQKLENDVALTQADAPSGRVRRSRLLAGIQHVIEYGQSNAVFSHGNVGTRISGDISNALMFNAGELTGNITDPPTDLASLVALNNSATGLQGWGSPIALMIKQLLDQEDGISAADLTHKWLFSSMGRSATAMEQLVLSTAASSYFQRIVRDLAYGADRAAEQTGAMQVYQPRNLLMVHGESDYSGTTTPLEKYVQKSARLAKDISYFARQESGREDEVVQWVVQVCSHFSYGNKTDPIIAKAQLEMERRGICMPIVPAYGALTQGGVDTDQIHYTAPGIIKIGATIGWQMKRYWYDGVIEKGCRIASYDKQGVWTLLEFSGVGDLVLDTSNLPLWANYGIQAVDSGGSAVTVSSVSIVDAPHRILAVKTASAPYALRFGWAGSTVTATNKFGGTNIRDSLRDVLSFDNPTTGLSVPIDNHLPIMELIL